MSMRINYIGGSGKLTGKSWYIPSHLVVRKMAEVVQLLGNNRLFLENVQLLASFSHYT